MRGLLFISIFLFGASLYGQTYGNVAQDLTNVEWLFDCGLLPNGNYLTIGMGRSTTTDEDSVFISEVDPITLDTVYTRSLFPGMVGISNSYLILNDSILIVSNSNDANTDIRLSKHGLDGQMGWSRLLFPSDTVLRFSHSFAIDVKGNLIISGYKEDTLIDMLHGFIMKCDTTGNVIWERTFGGPDLCLFFDVSVVDSTGYYASGYSYSGSFGKADAFVIMLDTAGNEKWSDLYGQDEFDVAQNIGLNNGDVLLYGETSYEYITGFTASKSLVRRIDSLGNERWSKSFENYYTRQDWLNCAFEYPDGDIILGGVMVDSVLGHERGWIVKIDSNGNEIWRRIHQNRNTGSYIHSIIETPDGGMLAVGYIWPNGVGTTQDGWLLKLDSMGCDTAGCHTVGTVEIETQDLFVYPNPTDGVFNVTSLDYINDGVAYSVYTATGKLVKKGKLTQTISKIDLSDQSSGVYLLRLISNKRQVDVFKRVFVYK